MDAAAHISKQAHAGDEFCSKVLARFFVYYGRVLGDYTITFVPREVYIAGGIMAANWEFFNKDAVLSGFRDGFA